MHELAFGLSGYNLAFKTGPDAGCATPMMRAKSPAVVRNGLAQLAPGLSLPVTDMGGSVRIPCALNGCASLRPTTGRHPKGGIAPIPATLLVPWPRRWLMWRSSIAQSPGRRDHAGGSEAPTHRGGCCHAGESRRRHGRRIHSAIDKLKAAGVTVVDIDMPKLAEINAQVGFPVALYEAYDDMVAYLQHTGTGITIEELAKSKSRREGHI